jgi:hypothetical protein
MPIRVLILSFIAVAWSGAAGGQEQAPGAKELFYDPVAKHATLATGAPAVGSPTRPAGAVPASAVRVGADGRREIRTVPADATRGESGPIGLSGWIELEDPAGGPGVQVTDRRIFRSGERIRLHFRSNTDGYLTLIQLGSSGTSNVLFPDPAQGLLDNRVTAGRGAVVPGEGHWLRFDDTAGEERLLVIFARSQEEAAAFPVRPAMDKVQTAALVDRAATARGSKDLVVETETTTAAEIGTYGVHMTGKPVVLEIILQHR